MLALVVAQIALAGCTEAPATGEVLEPQKPGFLGSLLTSEAAAPERVEVIPERPADPRPLLAQVTEAALEPALGGVILRVRGLAAAPGWHSVALVQATPGTEGVYRLVGLPPTLAAAATPGLAAREVLAATFIETRDLQGLREVRVIAATGSRSLTLR